MTDGHGHTSWSEYIDSVDQKHEDAHKRLRESLRDIEQKLESNYEYFRDRVEANKSRIEHIALTVEALGRAPVNIDKILFTPRVVVAIVVSLLSIYGFFLASTSSLRSDLHDLKTQIEARQVADKARQDLQDVQATSIQNTVEDMKRQLQLQQYEIQNLKDIVTDRRKAAK